MNHEFNYPSCGGEIADATSISPPRCKICGELFDSLESAAAIGRDRSEPKTGRWLLLPWLAAIVILLALVSGSADWLTRNLPFNLGYRAMNNTGWGLFFLTVGSSARWAYLKNQVKIRRGEGPLLGGIVTWTIIITLVQLFTAFGVAFAGCLIFVGSWH